jgi:hypothetical protein
MKWVYKLTENRSHKDKNTALSDIENGREILLLVTDSVEVMKKKTDRSKR